MNKTTLFSFHCFPQKIWAAKLPCETPSGILYEENCLFAYWPADSGWKGRAVLLAVPKGIGRPPNLSAFGKAIVCGASKREPGLQLNRFHVATRGDKEDNNIFNLQLTKKKTKKKKP